MSTGKLVAKTRIDVEVEEEFTVSKGLNGSRICSTHAPENRSIPVLEPWEPGTNLADGRTDVA
jgi:hypothetical protein